MEDTIKKDNCENGCDCCCDDTCKCGCNDGLECNCDCNCNDECKCDCGCECDCHPDEKKSKKEKKKDKKDSKKEEELELKIKALEEQSLRDRAELINYRKRKEEETTRMLKFCNEDLIKDILPSIDNFERAIKMDDKNLEDEVSKFLSGIKMIYCNLVGILEKYGVKAIDGANKQFDPTYHQAVLMEKCEGVEPGMVLEVLQKGYLLKDRVIRPAMVKVSE